MMFADRFSQRVVADPARRGDAHVAVKPINADIQVLDLLASYLYRHGSPTDWNVQFSHSIPIHVREEI